MMEGNRFGLCQTTSRFLLAELDPSEQRKQQAAPGSDPELRSSIGSTQVRILQILKSSTTVTSFTLRDDE
jgi:hypothetical protein